MSSKKRKRKLTYGSTKKKSKTKAKTKVDKRQDRTISKIKKLFAPERKWLDLTMATTISNGSPLAYDFAGSVPVWDATNASANQLRSNQREGEKIYLKGVSIRGVVQMDMQSTLLLADLTNRVRMILVHVPIPNWSGPAVAPLGDYLSAPARIDSLYLKPKKYDYNVLWDKTVDLITLTSQATGSGALGGITSIHGDARISWKYNLKKYFKLNRMITFDRDTAPGQVARPIKNLFVLYMFSDSSVPTHPLVSANVRVYFQDA